MLWHSTQSLPRHSLLPKCHAFTARTHTRAHTLSLSLSLFIYAHKEGKAFPESSFKRLINAQQCYMRISYPVSLKSDNKCEKYGYKLITLLSKLQLSVCWLSRNNYAIHFYEHLLHWILCKLDKKCRKYEQK